MKKIKYYLITIFLLLPISVFAQGAITSIVPACAKSGELRLTCFLELFINIANLIFGISGAVALAIFVLGGVQYILAAGNQEKVKKATSTLINGIIGLLIVLGAYLIVSSIIWVATGGQDTLRTIAPGEISGYLQD